MTKNRPIQLMLILGAFSLIGIVGVQVYWVSISVTAEEETFDHKVRMSLRAVADNMCQIDGNELIANKPIDRISRNYFVARLQYNIDISVLDSLIEYQFETRNINQDYEYGVYNCESNQMVFGNKVMRDQASRPNRLSLPKLEADEYYFGIYFPNKTGGLLASMSLWKYLTGATILIFGFFSYGLVIVLKQRRLSEIQKDFIDNVTHELKTPLATLRLSADAIKRNLDPTKTENYIAIIDQEIRRLEQHVHQILSSSGAEGGTEEFPEAIPIESWSNQLFGQFQEDYPNIQWTINVRSSGVIHTKRTCLDTIIRNLIDNAVKYGNGQVAVDISTKGKNFQVCIGDNGPGIPPVYQKRIYDKFFRVPTDNVHDVKGFGLGMYLVKENIRKIDGSITLASTHNGSKFTLTIPLK